MRAGEGMLPDEDALVIGRVVAAYGIKGWVKVQSFTDPKENIFLYQPWYLRGPDGWESVRLTKGRPQGKGLVASIDGCADRTQAETTQVGRDLAVPKGVIPPAGEDEIYWRDLIGLRVKLPDGRDLGELRQMFETGANDVAVVQGDAQSIDRRERLIPWLPEQVISDIDLAAGTLVADWDPEF